jgi:DNA-binding protein HU-beta
MDPNKCKQMTGNEIVLIYDFTAIKGALGKGEKVLLVGFGTFSVKERTVRKGRNPRTGKALKIPAKKVPAFSPGKGLKESV